MFLFTSPLQMRISMMHPWFLRTSACSQHDQTTLYLSKVDLDA
jgi:hypothetical protein